MYNRPMLFRRLLVIVILLLLTALAARAQEAGPTYWEQTELPQQGLATFYARGMMEYVYDYRVQQGDIPGCPECVGTVALLRAGDIGRRVWLQPPGGDPVGPFLVIDCARRQDVLPLLNRNWVVDVSYEVGEMWGMERPLDGVLVFEDPADAGAVNGSPTGRESGAPTRFYVEPGAVIISLPTATPTATEPGRQPTHWPTRQPSPLPGVTLAPTEATHPTITPGPPAVTPGPPPLTPIITTPTPEGGSAPQEEPTEPPPEVSAGAGLLEAPTVGPPTPEPEISLGRAGAGLLESAPADAEVLSTVVAPTRTRSLRTPRPDITPIIPLQTPSPQPGDAEESFWDRILRQLRALLD